ncbi:LON peptidase substrate-binding domain-containing protein [Nocardioides donggukensis]|uniref:LON peptidase substrate-binding domain-containing protein n=1 Tax=Nocardioides donggukensis TaxID=2774019 RepID=A0A927Q212_9ACTN|nr:LON peptidase substrate-binding domain-containing protein [Nocardioides donggukensis]MBD8869236.1 LON peptidase substrate-binding domain-containing protein [Nocardioides donggukensis]
MTETVPMFPLNTVLFPGISVPLHVFEDRYRALVHELLRIEDPAERLFGSVAIREGYEVGERGGQSVHRVGCLLQLTDVERNDDGTFDIVAVGRGRLRLEALETSGPFLAGQVDVLADPEEHVDPRISERARLTFEEYRTLLSQIRGDSVLEGDLPRDATYLSWSLAATCLLTLQDRQALLEAESASVRLAMVGELLRGEISAMTALPSLPATQVARTGWSPN